MKLEKQNGYYTKYLKGDKTSTLLIFVTQNKTDMFYRVLERVRNDFKEEKVNGYQCVFDKVGRDTLKNVAYIKYNAFGQMIDKPIIYIDFDFENNIVFINGKKIEVENDNKNTIYMLKTKIKAINGIKGLYDLIIESINADSVFHWSLYDGLLNKYL